jgi:hypothetical protein
MKYHIHLGCDYHHQNRQNNLSRLGTKIYFVLFVETGNKTLTCDWQSYCSFAYISVRLVIKFQVSAASVSENE